MINANYEFLIKNSDVEVQERVVVITTGTFLQKKWRVVNFLGKLTETQVIDDRYVVYVSTVIT